VTYRVIPLSSLADDLEEALVPTDYEGSARPILHPQIRARRHGEESGLPQAGDRESLPGRRCRCGAPKAEVAALCSSCRRHERDHPDDRRPLRPREF
jgi:hypothetical protein